MYKGKQDLAKVAYTNFKKVEHLDIGIPCSLCEELVHISQLFHHKKIHEAQAVLGYQWPWVKPTNIKNISLQRKQLILRLRKTAKYSEREIEKIGCSFDLLKESLKTAPYFCINNVAQSSVHIKEVSNPLIKAIAICQDKNAIWHTDLEDVCIVLDNYGHRKETCLLGLFDGSNGISAAQFTSDELPLLLLEQLYLDDPSYQINEDERSMLHSFRTIFKADYIVWEKIFSVQRKLRKQSQPNKYKWIHKAFAKAFWRMDRLLRLGRDEVSKVRWSSCTAAICLIEKISNEKQNQKQQEETFTMNDDEKQDLKQNSERKNIKEQADQILGQKQEEPLERINDGNDQSSIEQNAGSVTGQQQALALSRVRDGKEQNSTEHEKDSSTGQQQEESLERGKDRRTRITDPEDNKQVEDTKNEIQEEGSLEKDQSADEVIGLMHIANVGNVHAVLCKSGKSYWLTKDHSTYCGDEKARVLQNGGYISTNEPEGLVEGLIKNTRGLGHHGNPKLKKTVIPVPNTISFLVDNSCQFLIIASSGLWEVLDKNEVVLLTFTLFSAYMAKCQYAQLMKRRINKVSKEPLEDQVYSLYLNKEIFAERDSDLLNMNEESTETYFQQSLPADRDTKEKEAFQPRCSIVSSEDSLSESTLESFSTRSTSSTDTEAAEKENDKNEELVFESYEFLETSEDSETDSRSFYSLAAKYITKHLVKAALKAGSRNNVSVLLVFLNGCDNIPTNI